MTEQKSYLCDVCGCIYPNASDAESCERRHHLATGQGTFVYYSARSEYPDAVLIHFDNGTLRTYSLNPQ